MRTALLFVHGAFHGSWCFERVTPLLEAAGIATACVDLYRGSRDADVAAVQGEVDRLRGEGFSVMAVGHSLGCFAIAGIDPATVAQLVFFAGPLVGRGAPHPREATLPRFAELVTTDADGIMTITPDGARELFYHDCTEDDIASATARLRPNLSYGGDAREDPPIWKRVETAYIVCEDDRVLRPEYQNELAALTTRAERLSTSHSPMLCRPKELAMALGRIAGVEVG